MDVVLRPFTEADEVVLSRMFDEPLVRQWNPATAPFDAARWRADANVTDDAHRTWAIADPDDGRFLGTVSVFGVERPGDAGEIGYRVLASEAGRGVATAAVRAAVPLAAAALAPSSLALMHAVANAASCRVAEKCGFPLESVVPGTEVYGDGRLYDEHVHRLVLG